MFCRPETVDSRDTFSTNEKHEKEDLDDWYLYYLHSSLLNFLSNYILQCGQKQEHSDIL